MAEYTSSIDGSNKIIVPFEFKLGNLENLQNILKNLHEAAQDLPPEAREGMEIPQKGKEGPNWRDAKKGTGANEGDGYEEEWREAKGKKMSTSQEDKLLAAWLEMINSQDKSKFEATLESVLEKIGETGGQDGMRMLMNPRGFIMGLLSNPAVAAALLTAGFGMAMLEIAMMHSAPLDKHFKRIVRDEFINMIRPLQRRQTQVGIGRQVIFTSQSGSTQPELAVNSYDLLRRGEINQIEAWQIRKGYRW